MDLTRERVWVYHRTEPPTMVYVEDAQEWYQSGWRDTPAVFYDMKEAGLDPDNKEAVQVVGEAIKGVKDYANGALNIDIMLKQEMVDFAEKHFDCGDEVESLPNNDARRSKLRELIGSGGGLPGLN